MSMLQSYPTPHEQVAGRVIDNEAVLVLAQSGEVQVLNEVGARIWELIDGTRTVAQIAQTIADEYDVALEQAQTDVSEFIMRLVAEDVVVLGDQPSA
jgi:hypothetical protein